jgi:hypothetical protein
MVQKILQPISERFYECLLCQEAIYNPICSECIGQQLRVWLSSYPDLKKKVWPIIKRHLRDIHNTMHNASTCVACNKQRAAVCPYCFTNTILNILRKLEVNKIILSEFLKFFNFDYDQTGYTREARDLGIY